VLNSFEGDERNGWGKERILTTERHEQAQEQLNGYTRQTRLHNFTRNTNNRQF